MLVQVTSRYFCAGLEIDDESDLVVHAAPIIGYMHGWTRKRFKNYCKFKRWEYLVCNEDGGVVDEINRTR